MQRKETISFLFKVILLGLAILLIIFGLYPKLLNGENHEMNFVSPDGKSMPEEGYVTEMISGLSYVTVEVNARGEDVEVHMYVSTYRGHTVIKDANNESVLRDEWLAAGEKDERIGRNIKLSDITAYPARYQVKVVDPETSIPSDADYDIIIKAYTVNMTLIIAGLLFYAIFIFLGIFEYLSSINRTLKSGVAMVPGEAAEASDLEALLEPTAAVPAAAAVAAAPMAMAPEPALPAAPAPTSYDAMMEQQPIAPVPAPMVAAPPPVVPEAPAAYIPPPPPEVTPPPTVPPAAPAYQVPPPAAPAPMAAPVVPPPPPVAAAPLAAAPLAAAPLAAAPLAAPAPAAAPEPVSKVRCPACKSIVPVYTNERPTPIECATCGKKGMIR